MSFIEKIRRNLVLLALTGSMYFGVSSCDLTSRQNSQTRMSALALITSYDLNNATENLEEMFRADFSDLPNYILSIERVLTINELLENIKNYSKTKTLDALILAFHGNKSGIKINGEERIHVGNVSELFQDYAQFFSPDAVIIFYACSGGIGDINIAKSLAEILDRDVIAPRLTLITESDLEPSERVGEFALDENGRISFDYGNFRVYDEIEIRGEKYLEALATVSYRDFHGDIIKEYSNKKYFLIIDKQ